MIPEDSDVGALMDGKIAIVAMRVDEHDQELQARLVRTKARFPDWPVAVERR